MAKDVVERTEQNLSALENLLGVDTVEDVKKRIGDLIVNRVASDLDCYDMYLFYPDNYQRSIEESFEKVEKKINKMYADAMLEGLQLRNCHKCNHCNGNRCKFYENMYYWKAHDSICAEEGFINFIEKGK